MNVFFTFLLSNLLTTAASIITCISGIVAIAAAFSFYKQAKTKNSKGTEKAQLWRKITIVAAVIFLITLMVLCLQYNKSTSQKPIESDDVTSPAVSSTLTSPTSTPSAMPSTTPPPSAPPAASPISIAPPTTAAPAPDTSILSENVSHSRQDNENGDNIGDVGINTSINAANSAVDIKENNASGNESTIIQNSGDDNNTSVISGDGNMVIQENNGTITIGDRGETPVTVSKVSLSEERLDITTEDPPITLIATVLYSDNHTDSAVEWISSNPKVAAVNGGRITALAPGQTSIIAQATMNNFAKSAECTVTVSEPPQAPSGYSISLSTDSTTLGSQFKIYITPNEKDVTQIEVHAKGPSGQQYTYPWSKDKYYYIDAETGAWTIWATVKNSVDTYEGNKPGEFATINITPHPFNLFPPGLAGTTNSEKHGDGSVLLAE